MFVRSSVEGMSCGVALTIGEKQLYAMGNNDGSVTLNLHDENRDILAQLDSIDHNRRVIAIIHQSSSDNTVCLWVAYQDSIDQIACNMIDGEVVKFNRILSFKYNSNDFGNFKSFEILDSRFGKESVLALHFVKKSSALVMSLNIQYTLQLVKKIIQKGISCQDYKLPKEALLIVFLPRGDVSHSAVCISSIRTWSISYSIPNSSECDMKVLLSSYSYKVIVTGNKQDTIVTAHFTTAEQRIIDIIREVGVEAFAYPDTDISYSPSKFLSAEEKGTLFVYQRGDADVITSLTESGKVTKEIRESISTLWKACLHFKMFSVGREEDVCKLSESQGDKAQRMIVIETALAAGFGSLLADYVLHIDNTNTFSKDYLLVDVGTVFGWTIDLLKSSFNLAFNLTEQMLVPIFIHRNESTDTNMLLDPIALESARLELSSHLNTYNGLRYILKALLQRKISSFSTSFGSNSTSFQMNNFEAINEHKKMINKIEKLIIENNVVTGIIETNILLFNYQSFSLYSLITHNNNSDPLHDLISNIRLQRTQMSEEMLFLPNVLVNSDSLYDLLVQQLPISVQSKAILPLDINESEENDNYAKIAMLLWLPLFCVQNVEINDNENNSDGNLEKNGNIVNDIYIETAINGQGVVMYALLDALYLTKYTYQISANRSDINMNKIEKEIKIFSKLLCKSYNMPATNHRRFLSIFQVDIRIGMSIWIFIYSYFFCTGIHTNSEYTKRFLYSSFIVFIFITCFFVSFLVSNEVRHINR